MDEDQVLEEVKTCLRISTDQFDTNEIVPLIASAVEDMRGVGINVDYDNPLHRQAIKNYCKAYFGENPNKSDWIKAYEGLRDAISLRSEESEE